MTSQTKVQPRPKETIGDLKEHAQALVDCITQLRQQESLGDGDEIATYVIDTPLVHKVLDRFGDSIEEQTNTVDLVQVDLTAGNPMPEGIRQSEIQIGQDAVTVGISRA